MFIKLENDRILNADKVIYFELIPSLNTATAQIDAQLSGNKLIRIFAGEAAATRKVYCALANALSDGTKTVFDPKEYLTEVSNNG